MLLVSQSLALLWLMQSTIVLLPTSSTIDLTSSTVGGSTINLIPTITTASPNGSVESITVTMTSTPGVAPDSSNSANSQFIIIIISVILVVAGTSTIIIIVLIVCVVKKGQRQDYMNDKYVYVDVCGSSAAVNIIMTLKFGSTHILYAVILV